MYFLVCGLETIWFTMLFCSYLGIWSMFVTQISVGLIFQHYLFLCSFHHINIILLFTIAPQKKERKPEFWQFDSFYFMALIFILRADYFSFIQMFGVESFTTSVFREWIWFLLLSLFHWHLSTEWSQWRKDKWQRSGCIFMCDSAQPRNCLVSICPRFAYPYHLIKESPYNSVMSRYLLTVIFDKEKVQFLLISLSTCDRQ